MSEPDPKLAHDFLIALQSLTLQYGIAISGCGCCGSPFLIAIDSGHQKQGYSVDEDFSDICWITSDDEFDWETRKHLLLTITT